MENSTSVKFDSTGLNRNSPVSSEICVRKPARDHPDDRHQDRRADGDQGGVDQQMLAERLIRRSPERRRTDSAITSSSEHRKMMAIAIAEP